MFRVMYPNQQSQKVSGEAAAEQIPSPYSRAGEMRVSLTGV